MRSLLARVGPFAKGFAGAVAGLVLVLLLIHAWVDHKALHDLVVIVNQMAPKVQKLP